MRKLVFIPFFIFVFFSAASAFSANNEDDIKYKIKAANYCSSDSDCVIESFGCPFGCYNYVNKKESTNIKSAIKDFEGKRCMYKCPALQQYEANPVCKSGVCVKP